MSPLDLLTLPSEAQLLVRCLMREPGLTDAELAQRLNRPLAEVQGILHRLVSESRLVKHVTHSSPRYQVLLESPKPRTPTLLDALFS